MCHQQYLSIFIKINTILFNDVLIIINLLGVPAFLKDFWYII